MSEHITLLGVHTHNLKNIDVQFPKNKLSVVTGVSGSGKSSLAFQTLCNEGQRRYLESLSTYARMFIGGMGEEAKVREISGLSPTISVDQKTVSHNPRSTVGTITEIYDYYRLLYLHIGTRYCPETNKPLKKDIKEDIYREISQHSGNKIFVLIQPQEPFENHESIREYVVRMGFVRYMVGTDVYSLSDEIDGPISAPVYIVIDRLIVPDNKEDDSFRVRVLDSISLAYMKADGVMHVYNLDTSEIHTFSEREMCSQSGYVAPEFSLSHFSFNSHHGACERCHGLGHQPDFEEETIVSAELTLEEGAILPWGQSQYYQNLVLSIAKQEAIPIDIPFSQLSKKDTKKILFGTKNKVTLEFGGSSEKTWSVSFPGVIPYLRKKYHESIEKETKTVEKISDYITWVECHLCQGHRLRVESLFVRIMDKNIGQLANMNVEESIEFLETISVTENKQDVAKKILKNAKERLQFLQGVGLSYMTISRKSNTLSGGESQRIRLATQVGSKLEGITYVLDEPSIGLHPRDNDLLIDNLVRLVDIGNTVVVVEHDDDIMARSDHIIDIGPGAGIHGGELVFSGTYKDMLDTKTQTAQYLSGTKNIILPPNNRKNKGSISMVGARENNLQNISVDIPTGMFTCVTGVSGSGKSSLINKTLAPFLQNTFHRSKNKIGAIQSISGYEHLDKAIIIDQRPIGKTPRSNPATYTGVFTAIREVFSMTVESKKRGYTQGHFSFNTKTGRCPVCEGDGVKKVEMHFLPDMHITCEQCNGTRYNSQVREVQYRGKNISDILSMSIESACEFFAKIPKIHRILSMLVEVGLGYINLGQSAITLSGGESQRVKLATELSRRNTSQTIYILDEPTTGLHFSDIDRLIHILDKLVDNGNSVLVIEHNLDIIRNADWVIDVGPEGGNAGGQIVFSGTVPDLRKNTESHTARELNKFLERKQHAQDTKK